MKLLVTGYPYTRPNYRAALELLGSYFILPNVWKIKKGKAEYRTQDSPNILTTAAPLHHSDYPIIGGLLKGWMPLFPLLLWRMRRDHHVQLVFEAHEPTLLTTLYHGIFTKLFGLKHVVFSWENIPFEQKLVGTKGSLHRWILWANLLLADGVVCGNQKCKAIFQRQTRKPLALIPLAGLDSERFRPPSARGSREGITFVFAGALDKRKGLHILLPAFKLLRQSVPEARLVLVGSGTYEHEIRTMIRDLQLEVTFTPWTDHQHLIATLAAADVFVYPSIAHGGWEEQFGYSMAEASLMELPVIATRSGSIDEVVKDGETGILVEPGNVGELANAMRVIALDPALRPRYGLAGRNRIIQMFGNQEVARQYAVFFNSLVS